MSEFTNKVLSALLVIGMYVENGAELHIKREKDGNQIEISYKRGNESVSVYNQFLRQAFIDLENALEVKNE